MSAIQGREFSFEGMGRTMLSSNDVELTIRCKAFSGEGIRLNKVLVEPGRSGAILVWDSVAGHYTACHSIPADVKAKIRSQASSLLVVWESPTSGDSRETNPAPSSV